MQAVQTHSAQPGTTLGRNVLNKTTLSATLGTALEFYDFVTYAVMLEVIRVLFFPPAAAMTGRLETLFIFAAGYLARPLGGTVFGLIGDKLGRKSTFSAAILMMAISTIGIGVLPTYHDIGYTSTILLLCLRVLQGIAAGAEIPGAITFVCEHATKSHQAKHLSLLIIGLSLGIALSDGVSALLHTVYTTDEIHQYAWRFPFLLGGLLGTIGFFIRRYTSETPAFLNREHQHTSLRETLQQVQPLFIGFMSVFPPALMIIFAIIIPHYLEMYFGYPRTTIDSINSLSFVYIVVIMPIFGHLSDHYTPQRLFRVIALLACVLMYGLFQLISQHNTAMFAVVFCLTWQTLIAGYSSAYLTILARQFPTHLRYTSIGLIYNLAFSLASFLPLVTTYWLQHAKPVSLRWLFIVANGCALLMSFMASPVAKKGRAG